MSENNKLALFSFYSGIGLLDLGFEDEGFEIVFANELRPTFMEAYEYAREKMGRKKARVGHFVSSIDEFTENPKIELLIDANKVMKSEGYLTGFIGGPPCPDFSIGGKNRGKDGENGRLSKSYVDLICNVQPDYFIFENVKGLLRTKKHCEFFESLKKQLKRNGYSVKDTLLNSIEFSVAQDRDRVFLVGIKNAVFDKKKIRQFKEIDLRKYATYPNRVAFEHYKWDGKKSSETASEPPKELTIEFWFNKNRTDKHPNAKHCFTPRAALEKFQTIKEGDDSKKSFKRLHRYRYSPTAAYGNNEVHIHPTIARRLNVAEVMAIQSLPKEFELPEKMSLTDMFKTLGNAVPYLLARGVAKSLKDFFDTRTE